MRLKPLEQRTKTMFKVVAEYGPWCVLMHKAAWLVSHAASLVLSVSTRNEAEDELERPTPPSSHVSGYPV